MKVGCSCWPVDPGGSGPLVHVVLGHLSVPWSQSFRFNLMWLEVSDFTYLCPALLPIMHFSKAKRNCEMFLWRPDFRGWCTAITVSNNCHCHCCRHPSASLLILRGRNWVPGLVTTCTTQQPGWAFPPSTLCTLPPAHVLTAPDHVLVTSVLCSAGRAWQQMVLFWIKTI